MLRGVVVHSRMVHRLAIPQRGSLPTQKGHRMTNQKKTLLGVLALVGGVFVIGILLTLFAVRSFISSGATAVPDQMFGDQHLKTVVALVELHKVRYGSYPARLSELKFIGQWDALALSSVSYTASSDQQHYYVEVERGWAGKPVLDPPAEFWQGTGYDPLLNPSTQ